MNTLLEDDANNKVAVQFTMRGSHCNHWPRCRITINDTIIFDNEVEQVTVNVSFTLLKTNAIKIEHYGKRNGENRVWDTKVVDNSIVADCTLHVDDLKMFNISLKNVWHHGKMSDNKSIPAFSNAIHFYNNAVYEINFTAPFFDWLIDAQHRGFKEIGPLWKMSSLSAKADGYSSSMLELDPLLTKIQNRIDSL